MQVLAPLRQAKGKWQPTSTKILVKKYIAVRGPLVLPAVAVCG